MPITINNTSLYYKNNNNYIKGFPIYFNNNYSIYTSSVNITDPQVSLLGNTLITSFNLISNYYNPYNNFTFTS